MIRPPIPLNARFLKRAGRVAPAVAAALAGAMAFQAGATGVTRIEVSGIARCPAGRDSFCVVDGDTVRYRGERIRLSDIDTPETGKPLCPAELELGQKATLRLIAILNRGPFELVDTGQGRDRFGRPLRELRRDGQSIGDMLVEEGLAHRWGGHKLSWCA